MHNHGVVDNYHPVNPDLEFFPEHLQSAGYETAFIGKWHMGDVDDPQRGFDHWCAFKGQGTYWPDGHGTTRLYVDDADENSLTRPSSVFSRSWLVPQTGK